MKRFRTASMSHSEIREAIYSALDKRSRETRGHYCHVVDVWEGYCVYMSYEDDDDKSHMYKQMFSIGADETVTLDGDPVEIEPAYVKKGTMEVVASNMIFGQAAKQLLADLKSSNPLIAQLENTANAHFIVMDLTTIGAPSKHQGDTKYQLEKSTIQAAAHTLISKPVHVTENYDGHVDAGKDPVAIGVFMGSWLVENEDGTATMRAVASLWKNDFPDKVEFIANNAAQLGASYEVAYDPETAYFVKAEKGTVHIRNYEFAGGSILFKDKAAHPETQILVAGVDPEELKLDGLTAEERRALPDDDFAFVKKGTKTIRRFPMHTEAARARAAAPSGYLDFAANLTAAEKAMCRQRIVARALVAGDAWAKTPATTKTKPKEGGTSMKYKGIPEDLEGMVDLIVANAVQTATTTLAAEKKTAEDALLAANKTLEAQKAELETVKGSVVELTNTANKATADLEAKGKELEASVTELKVFQDAKAQLEEKAALDAEWKKISAQYGLQDSQRPEREEILKKLVARKESLTVEDFAKLTSGGSKGGPTVQLMAGTGEPGKSTEPDKAALSRTFPAALAAQAGGKLW